MFKNVSLNRSIYEYSLQYRAIINNNIDAQKCVVEFVLFSYQEMPKERADGTLCRSSSEHRTTAAVAATAGPGFGRSTGGDGDEDDDDGRGRRIDEEWRVISKTLRN